MKHLSIIFLLLSLAACAGEDNAADCEKGRKPVPCSARSADEEARLALDERDFDRAIELLQGAVDEEPENYERYPMLAAAYAGRGGIAIFDLLGAQFSGGGTLFDAIAAFLPDPAETGAEQYQAVLGDVKKAVDTLNVVPTARLDDDLSNIAGSTRFQLTLYNSAYSVMYLNQFTISATTGQVDLSQLENMTAADATAILSSLAAAAATQQGPEGEALKAKVDELLADINSQGGATDVEKLKEFAKKEQAPQ